RGGRGRARKPRRRGRGAARSSESDRPALNSTQRDGPTGRSSPGRIAQGPHRAHKPQFTNPPLLGHSTTRDLPPLLPSRTAATVSRLWPESSRERVAADLAATTRSSTTGTCAHHRPIIFATNPPLPAWAPLLHDADLDEAIRERGRHTALRGALLPTRHPPLDLKADAEPPSPAEIRNVRKASARVSEPHRGRPLARGRSACSAATARSRSVCSRQISTAQTKAGSAVKVSASHPCDQPSIARSGLGRRRFIVLARVDEHDILTLLQLEPTQNPHNPALSSREKKMIT